MSGLRLEPTVRSSFSAASRTAPSIVALSGRSKSEISPRSCTTGHEVRIRPGPNQECPARQVAFRSERPAVVRRRRGHLR